MGGYGKGGRWEVKEGKEGQSTWLEVRKCEKGGKGEGRDGRGQRRIGKLHKIGCIMGFRE